MILTSFINLLLNVFYLVFWAASIFFQFRSVSVSISIIWHAGLFFRSYSGNLPAMFNLKTTRIESSKMKNCLSI